MEDLKGLLKARALREAAFFKDASELSIKPSIGKINDFERKYGDYHELDQSVADDELNVAAVVAELKARLHGS